MLTIVSVTIKWEAVASATGYEILKDGVVVATTGANARTSKVSVDEGTRVGVVDLPARSSVQEIHFSQLEL